jgi:hypothetical protein
MKHIIRVFSHLTLEERKTLSTLLAAPPIFIVSAIGWILIERISEHAFQRPCRIIDHPGQVFFEALLLTLISDIMIFGLFMWHSHRKHAKRWNLQSVIVITQIHVRERQIAPKVLNGPDGAHEDENRLLLPIPARAMKGKENIR